jgi:hypothetical protein
VIETVVPHDPAPTAPIDAVITEPTQPAPQTQQPSQVERPVETTPTIPVVPQEPAPVETVPVEPVLPPQTTEPGQDLFGEPEQPTTTPPAETPVETPTEEPADLFGAPEEPAATPPVEETTPPADTIPPAEPPADESGDLFGEPAATEPTDEMPADTEEAPAEPPTEEPPTPADEDDIFGTGTSSVLRVPGGLASMEMRTWVDNTGKYSCRGRLVRFLDGQVQLIKDNGRSTTVPLHRLSADDLNFVNRQASAQQAEAFQTAQR